jgi:predicted Zn-ribbon and HTH transcriptional regulator
MIKMTLKTDIRAETQKLIRAGKIIRPETCEQCGGKFILHCHHNDYEDPMDVSFLCSPCHYKKHSGERKGISWKRIEIATCMKCGHEWAPRVKNPVLCPRCKNPNWGID